MLTSFLVTCPHLGCEWFGSLLPRGNAEAWRGPTPTRGVVHFQCPKCKGTWDARVIGDDVELLPLEEPALPVA
jgi:hypothetical protein